VLLELRVENLLLIERAELRLGPGLNVLTGETGAGKTILAGALDLLLGGKPPTGTVRPGASEAWVEGVFELPHRLLEEPELGDLRERMPDDAEALVLGRRVSATGRTSAFVQGRAATAADLRRLGTRLLSFLGQHEHRRLLLATTQLEVLDAFCGPEHLSERDSYTRAHTRAAALRRELEKLGERAGARERDLDLLVYEIEEIEALDPDEEEQEALTAERDRLRHLEALRAAGGGAAEALAPESGDGSGGTALLAEAERLGRTAAGVDPELDALSERVCALRLEAEDVAGDLRRYVERLEGEPGRLEQVEGRLDELDRLLRKHGGSVTSVLAHLDRCRVERDRLANAEVALEEAQAALTGAEHEERERAQVLSAARAEAVPALEARVLEELRQLALEGASFSVELTPRETLGPRGAENVELLLAANPGVPPAPLREAASGGELSRVMLALMGVASASGPPTLVFDEVDAGVGGQTARAVAERLRRLGRERQLVCITHLPQIAALAESHFRIEKLAAGELAETVVERLDQHAVVDELCRMLGGEAGDTGARRHAEELLAA
jgi:DNA repair protein RecN (Recombination protein N)